MNEIANVASPGFTDLLANNNCTSQTAQVESCSSFGQNVKDPHHPTIIISHLVNSTIQDIQVSSGNERRRSVLCKVGDLTASV